MKHSFDKGILKKFYRLPYETVSRRMNERTSLNININEVCEAYEKCGRYYLSYNVKPKNPMEVPALDMHAPKGKKTAIILQGPIVSKNNFTLSTVELYRRYYPSYSIIVSTWADQDKAQIRSLEQAGAEIVLSDLPEFHGHSNINLQIKSSLEGLKRAKELGVYYACKTRCDNRIYRLNAVEWMKSLTESFPSKNPNQNSRIVLLSMVNGGMFWPYYMSDFMYFGNIDDLLLFFSMEPDKRTQKAKDSKLDEVEAVSKKYISKYDLSAESELLRNYAREIGMNDNPTVECFWEMMKEALIGIGREELDLWWPKYKEKYRQSVQDGSFSLFENENEWFSYNFNFINWLNLYFGNIQYRPEYEKYADYVVSGKA